MHVRSADPAAVKEAIDQCAAVGFEMVILTFGSGFDIENEQPDYLAQIKSLADYGHSKGVALAVIRFWPAGRLMRPMTPSIPPPANRAESGSAIRPVWAAAGGKIISANCGNFLSKPARRAGKRRLLSRRCLRLHQPSGSRRAGGFAMETMENHLRILRMVPGAGRLSQRSRLVLFDRLQQMRHGLSRDRTGPCRGKHKKSSNGKTFSTAPGKRRPAWAGCSSR